MWIQVRTMDGKKSSRIDGLSKLTKVEDLRKLLVDKFDAPVSRQRLFFRGKQLEDGHTLFDYNVGLNEIIQIIVRDFVPEPLVANIESKSSVSKKVNKENKSIPSSSALAEEQREKNISKFFKVGDLIDAKDMTYGAWFEAKIIDIKVYTAGDKPILQLLSTNNQSEIDCSNLEDDGLIYKVVYEDYEDSEDPVDLSLKHIRPRARKLLKLEDVKDGALVMVNYNIEEPNERGFWYDCRVSGSKNNRTAKYLKGTIIMGVDETPLENCKICFIDEIFAVEKNVVINNELRNINSDIVTRTKMPNCTHCKDIPSKKCKICSCHICGGKDFPEKQIMCDECDLPYHLWCLKPPLENLPEEDEWFCPECKIDKTEVVCAGEKLKASKKKAKMASANSKSSRDWGKGMACVGRTKQCTIVPPNHFGPIPGIEVGTMWKFRVQVSESGVHRPHVAGIHGREGDGAYSIVLSGGYEDDLDEGEEFKYTGSGGRDLSGNKRCAEQSCDQSLTRMNKALALNCNIPLNKNGAETRNWQGGKPVRVVRNCKGRKHSEYCPEEGNRYDGIYKVVKYWPEKGKSGFLVWRYLLRRDDPSPAPWTKAGKKRMKELGLTMQYPEGYSEKQEEVENSASEDSSEKGLKRKQDLYSNDEFNSSRKKRKSIYALPDEHSTLIKKDKINKKLWNECLLVVSEGSQEFLKKVENVFACICCQDLVLNPITTACAHNICTACLERSFKAEVYTCPMCRQELTKSCIKQRNEPLQKVLLALFPGYDAGR